MSSFEYKIQPRYPDFDTQLFVNHSKICTYIESTYVSFLIDGINTGWSYANLPVLLKKESTDFLSPITPTSNPICKLVLKELRGKGINIEVTIYDEIEKERVYAKGERILIHVDLATVTPLYFPSSIVDQLKSFLNQTD